MYHTDSNKRLIYRLEYEPGTGNVSNRSVLVQTPDSEGVPDGMAVDADGTIWSARWNGNALFRYSEHGVSLGKVTFPVRKVSSVAFGGNDLADAYVTTAGGPDRGEIEGAFAGSLFRVNLGISGRPGFKSRVGL